MCIYIYIYICTTAARKTFNITQVYNNVGNHGGKTLQVRGLQSCFRMTPQAVCIKQHLVSTYPILLGHPKNGRCIRNLCWEPTHIPKVRVPGSAVLRHLSLGKSFQGLRARRNSWKNLAYDTTVGVHSAGFCCESQNFRHGKYPGISC